MTFSRSFFGASVCQKINNGTVYQVHFHRLSDYPRSYISTFILLRSSSVNCVDIYDPSNIPANLKIFLANRTLACALIQKQSARRYVHFRRTFLKHTQHTLGRLLGVLATWVLAV